MRIPSLVLTISWVFAGCGDGNAQDAPGAAVATGAQDTPGGADPAAPTGTWQKLVMLPFVDSQGTVTASMPLPADWRIVPRKTQDDPTLVGPHGIQVIEFPLQFFTYTSDPWMQQSYAQSGQRLRAFPGVEQVVKQDLVPWAAGQGLTLERQYEVPEVTRIDRWYNDQLFKAMPSQMNMVAWATEWRHVSGAPFFLLMHLSSSDTPGMQIWSYYCHGLRVKPEHYETAKKQLIFGLANTHYNPEAIMAYNRREAEKAGQSWAAHNKRMAANQAAFEASQRDFVNRSNSINDSIMSGWRERNASSDRAHEQVIDTITGRSNVVDPSTGQTYKVESGSNQYWMNANGEYIGTNDVGYDPNLDEALNREGWTKLEDGN